MTNVLIAFADAGGGHRAAAHAIREAILESGSDLVVTLRDPWADRARWPFTTLRWVYPLVVQHAQWLWALGFALTNRPRIVHLLQRLAWPVQRKGFTALAETTPDLIVCTHPLLTTPLRRVFPRTPIIVVVTDLVSGHVSWYDDAADLLVVPTAAARDAAVAAGIPAPRLHVLGLPVSPAFLAVPGDRAELLVSLGWSLERPTILLAGGAEGIGNLEALTVAIDRAQLPCDVAVVAGRNSALAQRLRTRRWQGIVHVYDFVSNFSECVRAAAALVTKAGPGTIAEACASGCPVILTSAIAGQEAGNVDFVTRGRAGVWAPTPLATTVVLHAWLVGRDAPAALRRAATGALKLARPHAAADIARLIRASLAAASPTDEQAAQASAAA